VQAKPTATTTVAQQLKELCSEGRNRLPAQWATTSGVACRQSPQQLKELCSKVRKPKNAFYITIYYNHDIENIFKFKLKYAYIIYGISTTHWYLHGWNKSLYM
jgi:hypothetical protein